MSEPEKPSPTETNVAAPAATSTPAAAATPTPAAAATAVAKPSAGSRSLAAVKLPSGRRARVAVAAGLVVAVGLIAGVVAWPKSAPQLANDSAAGSTEPTEDAEVASSRRARPACDLLDGALDEDATPIVMVAPSSRPVEDVAASRPAEESAVAASRPAEEPAVVANPKKPAVGLSAGLLDVVDSPAEAASDSRPASRPAPVDPTEFAAAEAAYAKGEWKNARDSALRFLMRPGPLGDREEELIGRAHVRLALALARIRREDIGASDESLPEPVIDFPESRP